MQHPEDVAGGEGQSGHFGNQAGFYTVASDLHFELDVTPTEVKLRIYPPEGEKRANLNDIQKALTEFDVEYRMENLFEIYRRASNEFETLAKRETTKYGVGVEVSPDGFEAYMTVNAPSKGESQLAPEAIKNALEKAQVEKGIRYDEIKRVMADKVEGERILVAEGKRPIQGEDGWIEFNTEHDQNTAGNVEDNRANYKELNLIKSVEEGYLIGRIFPPTRGEHGFNVKGQQVKGYHGKRAKFRMGGNISVDEEHTEIRAEKAGFVVFSNDKVSVEDVLELPNVDSETGNVRFTGVVRVKGQVDDGFIVEGSQGIQVLGTVGNATMKSRGDIHVTGGMIGAKVRSGNSVRAKFITECQVYAGSHVIADDYILHSTVQAGNAVIVSKPMDGFITGGVVRAGQSVWAPSLGSDVSGEKTKIEVGVELNLRRAFENLQKQIAQSREKFEKLRKNIRVMQSHKETKGELPPENEASLEKMLTTAQSLRGFLLESGTEHHRLEQALRNSTVGEGFVFASANAYAGTSIQIKRHFYAVNSPLESCAFRIVHDEMKVQNFGQAQRYYKQNFGKLPN